jgi:hypothetical protein
MSRIARVDVSITSLTRRISLHIRPAPRKASARQRRVLRLAPRDPYTEHHCDDHQQDAY